MVHHPLYLACSSRWTFVAAQDAMLVASDVVYIVSRTVFVVSKLYCSELQYND